MRSDATTGGQIVRDDAAFTDGDGHVDPIVEDLLGIAGAAFLVDRRVRRGSPETREWQRELSLEVHVRRPDFWRRPEVHEALAQALDWSTQDRWSFTFHEAGAAAPARPTRWDFDDREREVVLFSGGLDSTAGAALLLQAGQRVLGVAVYTNKSMLGYQRSVTRALQDSGLGSLVVREATFHRRGPAKQEDPTRRTRGLVFLVHGWAVARSLGRRQLLVLENGVGALNLPLTAGQHGVMTSRSVHPRTLELASRLFSLVDDEHFSVDNPHLHETKGQMCARLPVAARQACAASQSCDHAASGRRTRRCRQCTSCLLRQIALASSDRSDWEGAPATGAAEAAGTPGERPLRAMLSQARTVAKALSDSRPAAALGRSFPDLADVPFGALDDAALVRLYRAHVEECSRYPHRLVRSFLTSEGLAA